MSSRPRTRCSGSAPRCPPAALSPVETAEAECAWRGPAPRPACSPCIPSTRRCAPLALGPSLNGVPNPPSTAFPALLVLPLAPGSGAFNLEKEGGDSELSVPAWHARAAAGKGRKPLGAAGVRTPPACPGPRPSGPTTRWVPAWSSGGFLYPALLSYS